MTLAGDPFEGLRRSVHGAVLGPGAPGFDDRRRTFNAMLDRSPRVIVQPRDTADVVGAVRWAAASGLQVSVRGGGHSVAGHAVGENAVMIDLAALRGVRVDREAQVAHVGGGALLEDLDRATTSVGLAAPSGTYLDTGVAGLTLSGGIGFLIGKAGFACDALMGATLVTADGAALEVDDTSDPELLWALRGGGGNFGVVTELRHALVPLRQVYGGRIRVAGDGVRELVARLFALQGPDASDELTLQATVGRDGAGAAIASVLGLWTGDPARGPSMFAPLRELAGIYHDSVGPTTYLAMQLMSDRMGPTFRHYWKGQFVRSVEAALQDVILERAAIAPAASELLLEPIHGVAHRIPEGHAAFGGRSALANVSALGIWSEADDDAAVIQWARETTLALEPFSVRGGGYLNYAPEDESAGRVEQAFGTASFRRLQAVKARLDPENRFRFNANIPPA